MSRRCELTSLKPGRGYKISHSHRKSLRRLLPNLQSKLVFSSLLGQYISVKVAAKALKTMDKCGGIDNAILNADHNSLSPTLRQLRKRLLKRVSDSKTASPQ